MREKIVGAAINGRSRHNVITGGSDILDRVRRRRGTGCNGQSGRAALESCYALLENIGRRIHDTGIDIAGLSQAEKIGTFVGILENV